MIYYSGIGAKTSGIHSEVEFLDIMIRNFIEVDWNDPDYNMLLHQLREFTPDRRLPEDFPLFSLDDWLEWSGAVRVREN